MNQEKNKGAEYDFYGKLPLQKAILLGLQHVFAMFVGNLTPVLIITGACGIASGTEFADVQIALLQNAMLIAGIVTLIQLYAIGPIGGKVPINASTRYFFRFFFCAVFIFLAVLLSASRSSRSCSSRFFSINIVNGYTRNAVPTTIRRSSIPL